MGAMSRARGAGRSLLANGFGFKKWVRLRWMPSLAASLMTLVVAGRGISVLPLRFDEFFSLNAVVNGPLNSLGSEGPLVPFYSILWLWSLGGEWTSDLWLRSLSLLAIVLTAAITAQIARQFGGLATAYIAGLLFALNPGIQFTAQDARPYSIGILLFTYAAFLLLSALNSERIAHWIALSTVLFLATLIMPNGLVFLIPLLLLYGYVKPRFYLSKPFLIALLPTLVLIVVGVVALGPTISTMRASLPSPLGTWIPTGVIWIGIAEAESYGAPGTFAAVLLVLAALTPPGRRVLWGALLSVLAVWVISQGPSSQWMGRTFVTLLPVVAVAAAIAVARLDRRAMSAVIAVAILFAIPGYTAVRIWDSPADLRLASQILEQEAAPTDQIFGDGYMGQGRPFELAAGLSHYASKKPTWEVTTKPTSEFWLLYPNYPCEEIFSADVLGGMRLRRCAAPE